MATLMIKLTDQKPRFVDVNSELHVCFFTDRDGLSIQLHGSIEQLEDFCKAGLDYIHAYNAAAMVETVKRMEGQVA